ncbi:hypothetical protein NDU88_001187 [Pleurodeles waltl]|uniref:Uncharacterized protein n=1 Tax=Pleurodeles waltl TaxID=8319 RepID=A0AAV7VB31_PLEWA|nr:hypothetical protein NDU88_001187 [Pleurodeles waltl]
MAQASRLISMLAGAATTHGKPLCPILSQAAVSSDPRLSVFRAPPLQGLLLLRCYPARAASTVVWPGATPPVAARASHCLQPGDHGCQVPQTAFRRKGCKGVLPRRASVTLYAGLLSGSERGSRLTRPPLLASKQLRNKRAMSFGSMINTVK